MRNVITGLALMVCGMAAFADDAPIGYVKTTTGQAYVVTQARQVDAQPGIPVFLGSLLKTGRDGSLGVTFKDDTVMSFGPDTELTVDEYLYAPTQGKLKLGSKLAKGSMNYISGKIAKLKPEEVTVTTPTGTIGVRGTNLVAKVEE